MLYAWYHDLKRKCQNYNSKKSPNPDSSEGEEEVPESQMGNINLYNHDDEIGGWLQLSLQHQKWLLLQPQNLQKQWPILMNIVCCCLIYTLLLFCQAQVSIFRKYLNPKINSYNLKFFKVLRNKCNERVHCHQHGSRKCSYLLLLWLSSLSPPPWKNSLAAYFPLIILGIETPSPPWSFHPIWMFPYEYFLELYTFGNYRSKLHTPPSWKAPN